MIGYLLRGRGWLHGGFSWLSHLGGGGDGGRRGEIMRRGGGCYDQAIDPIFMEAPRSPYGEFPNDEHATAKLSGPCNPREETGGPSRAAHGRRACGGGRAQVAPGEHALELVLVRVLVSAECLRAVELPPALVAREQLWRLGLDSHHQ